MWTWGKFSHCQQRIWNVRRQHFTERTIATAFGDLLLHLRKRDHARQTSAIHDGPGIAVRIEMAHSIFDAVVGDRKSGGASAASRTIRRPCR